MTSLSVLQVSWCRTLLLQASPPLLPWLLLWLGLPVAGDGPSEVPQLTLEAMLRMKALVLVATALRDKAQRWQQKLPPAVVAAAEAHWPCPVFWPPRGAGAVNAAAQGSAQAARGGDGGHEGRGSQQLCVEGGEDPAGVKSLQWEELEPVLRRAGQLVSPLKALVIKVSCSGVQGLGQAGKLMPLVSIYGSIRASETGMCVLARCLCMKQHPGIMPTQPFGCMSQCLVCCTLSELLGIRSCCSLCQLASMSCLPAHPPARLPARPSCSSSTRWDW